MAKTYTVSEAQALLGVDAKTFRKWLEKAEIDVSKQVSKLDERIRYVTETQLQKLAKDHGRDITSNAWQKQAQDQEAGSLAGKLKLVDERLSTLEARPYIPSTLLQRLDELQKQYEELEHKYGDLLIKHGDVLLRLQALEQPKKPGRKPRAQGEVEAAQGDD